MNNRKKKPQMEMLNMSCFAHYESELYKEHELKMIGDYKHALYALYNFFSLIFFVQPVIG